MNHNTKSEIVIGRKRFVTPFSLSLVKSGGQQLECHQLLRLVPGKRAVLLGRWCGRPVVAKLFYKRFRAGNHVDAETQGNRYLNEAGIRTAKILYTGAVSGNPAQAVVFESLHPSQDLGKMVGADLDISQCRYYFEMLMVMIAQMHENGLVHNDLHLGNFLIKNGELYALDAAALKKKARTGKLDRQTSLKNLAVLLIQLNLRGQERFRELVLAYCKARDIACSDELIAELKQWVVQGQHARIQKYLKKIYRASTETVCKKSWTDLTLCKRTHYTPAMAEFLKHPDVAFDASTATLLKRGHTASVAKVRVDDRELVVKRYNVKHPLHGLRIAFRRSRGDRSWFSGHMLMAHGIRTPAPIALKETRFGPLRHRAWLICDHIEGISARDYFQTCPFTDQYHISKQILDIFKRLQALCISHGDMKATNMIIHQGKVYLIDLDSMVVHSNMARFKRASHKDIKRFMKNWEHLPEIAALFPFRVR